MTSNVGYVDKSILVSDSNISAARLQVFCDYARFRPRDRDCIGDGEIQREVFNITRVILQLKL
jgi:hypothetical protein